MDIDKGRLESFKDKLKFLPKYFTLKQFDDFVRQSGFDDCIKTSSDDPENAVTLTIYTQEWMVDSDKNMLFCNPQTGNKWGTLAKLDAEEWCDFLIHIQELLLFSFIILGSLQCESHRESNFLRLVQLRICVLVGLKAKLLAEVSA